jgi:hypothetical protein
MVLGQQQEDPGLSTHPASGSWNHGSGMVAEQNSERRATVLMGVSLACLRRKNMHDAARFYS